MNRVATEIAQESACFPARSRQRLAAAIRKTQHHSAVSAADDAELGAK